MVNYQNGKIYMLWSPSTDKRYIGSTTLALSQRLAQHKSTRSKSTRSRLMFEECNDIKIELIENCPCDSKEELLKREGEIIRETDCVNRCIAGRTPREYREENKEKIKEYYENNKVIFLEKAKEYKKNNKEKIKEKSKIYREENKERQNEKFECPCGGKYTYANKSIHFKSKMHINYIHRHDEKVIPID